MRIAFLAAECEPWAKTGGLGDVVDALARAVGRIPGALQRPADVYLPRYRGVPVPDALVSDRATVTVPDTRHGAAPDASIAVTVTDVRATGYRLRLVECPDAFDRDAFYGPPGGEYPDNAWRFSLFARAALRRIDDDGGVDLLHLHDWHAVPAVLLRDAAARAGAPAGRPAVLLTLHNLAYHGWTGPDRAAELGGDLVDDGARAHGIDLLRTGIERAELSNTVSPGFARQARTSEYGMGLDDILRDLGDRFSGILNGIDTQVWDPATDRDIAAPFDRADRTGKLECRAELLESVGMDPTDDGPVLAMIGRLDQQKGFDLLAGAAERLLERGARLIVLGSGDPALADPFRGLAASRPDRLVLIETFDRALARRIYAGADLFVMPSRFEPCGQGQMIAMRYGAPPIVRRTGGLADTVIDADDQTGDGTGFVFDHASPDALLEAAGRALAMRQEQPDRFEAVVDRGMQTDFDWDHGPAQAYLAAYRRAIALRQDHT